MKASRVTFLILAALVGVIWTLHGAFAEPLGDSLVMCYSADESVANQNTVSYNQNLTSTGTPGTRTGKVGSLAYDAPNDDNSNYRSVATGNAIPDGNTNLTICDWHYLDTADGGSNQFYMSIGTASANTMMAPYIGVSPNNEIKFSDGDTDATSGFNTAVTTWYHTCVVYNATGSSTQVYVNNAVRITHAQAITRGNDILMLGQYPGAASFGEFDGAIDEVMVFNKSLSASEVSQIYNGSTGISCSYVYANRTQPPTLSPPSWVSPTPAAGTVNNTQVTLNASSTSPGVRYYVWFDSNPNPTTLVVNNASTGNYTTSVGSSTTTYYYKAAVWNATIGFSVNTTAQNWTYDAVNPAIVLNPTNEFNAQNYSRRSPFDDLVSLNITFTDDHDLFGMNVNITRGGVVYFNLTNTSLDGTSYTYAQSVDASTWPVGRYNATIEVSDSHTAREIPEYQITKKKSSLSFTTGTDTVEIASRDASTMTPTKKTDRYTFRVQYDDGATKARTFDVKTNRCPIVYKPNSGYKAHLVASCGSGGNWIDFEGVAGVPTVERVSAYHYTVTFGSLGADNTFQSLGGLNVLSANYTFYLGNYSTLTTSPVLSGESSVIGLNLTTESGISNISATVKYNGTTYVPEVTANASLYNFTTIVAHPNATVTLNFNWTVTVTQGDGNTSVFNVSATQDVRTWSITTCGTTFINWTQYDEDNPSTKLSGTLALEIEYWVDNRSNARFYNTTFSTDTSWRVCFIPADGTFYANIYAQNTVPDSFTHRFYIQNGTFTNTTTFYSLYNANNTNDALYSDMKITTRLVSSYGYFKNVFAQLQRRYVGEGVWRTVQYDKSGDFGLIFFDVREQNTDYRIRYYDENNSLLLATDSLKFVCTSFVCELTQLLNPATGTVTAPDVIASTSFNNATSVLTVTWESTSSEESDVVITVKKQAFDSLTSICTTTQTGTGGSFACNATGYSGDLFVTLDVDGSQSLGEFVTIPRTSLATNLSQENQALLTFIIMVTIIMFGIFSPFSIVITTVIGLIVVFFFGTMTGITTTFIIIAAVIGLVIGIKVKQ